LDSAVLGHVVEREGALGTCNVLALGDTFGHSSKAGSLNITCPQRGSKNPPFLFYYSGRNTQSRIISAAENGSSDSGWWQSSWLHCGLCLGTESFGNDCAIDLQIICCDHCYIK